jgi:trk system potassium uptake protein TrkA
MSLGINDCDIAVVAIGVNFEMSVLATAILKNIGIPMIISRATTDIQGQILYKVGAHKVINIESAMGVNVAKSLVQDKIKEHIPLASGHSMIEVEVSPAKVGKTLLELNVRKNFGINIVAVQTTLVETDQSGVSSTKMVMNDLPGPDTLLKEGDILCIVGLDEKIEAFIES